MWLSPKWFCFLFIYFVLYHGPEASKVQIKLTYYTSQTSIVVQFSLKLHNLSVENNSVDYKYYRDEIACGKFKTG